MNQTTRPQGEQSIIEFFKMLKDFIGSIVQLLENNAEMNIAEAISRAKKEFQFSSSNLNPNLRDILDKIAVQLVLILKNFENDK